MIRNPDFAERCPVQHCPRLRMTFSTYIYIYIWFLHSIATLALCCPLRKVGHSHDGLPQWFVYISKPLMGDGLRRDETILTSFETLLFASLPPNSSKFSMPTWEWLIDLNIWSGYRLREFQWVSSNLGDMGSFRRRPGVIASLSVWRLSSFGTATRATGCSGCKGCKEQ
jgi:hypothetical protein